MNPFHACVVFHDAFFRVNRQESTKSTGSRNRQANAKNRNISKEQDRGRKREPNPNKTCRLQVSDGINAYGVGSHRHAPEIEQGLGEAIGGKDVVVNFTPHLMPMSRGILEVKTENTGRGQEGRL